MFPTFIHVTRLQHTWISSQKNHFTACLLKWYKLVSPFSKQVMKSHDHQLWWRPIVLGCSCVCKCFVVQLNHYHKLILCIFSSSLERNELLQFEENCAIDTAWKCRGIFEPYSLVWLVVWILIYLSAGLALLRYLVFVKYIEIFKLESKVWLQIHYYSYYYCYYYYSGFTKTSVSILEHLLSFMDHVFTSKFLLLVSISLFSYK